MDIDEIKKQVLKAMFSDIDLKDLFVFKGENVLNL